MPRYSPAPLPAGYSIREDSQRRFQGEAPNGDRSTWYTRRQGAVDWCWKHQHGRLASQRAATPARRHASPPGLTPVWRDAKTQKTAPNGPSR